MSLSKLNDDCLLSIFGHLSQSDRLSAECVCRRWQHLISTDQQHKQTSLKLIADAQHFADYVANKYDLHLIRSCGHFTRANDILLLPTIDFFIARSLISKFSHLTSLLIFGCRIDRRSLQTLIEHWTTSLQCLTLIDIAVEPTTVQLIETRLPNLKHFACNAVLFTNVQFISRLEHLHVKYNSAITFNGLKRLSLYIDDQSRAIFSEETECFECVSHLTIILTTPLTTILSNLPKCFPNLVYLSLSCAKSIPLVLIEAITLNLSKLIELRLHTEPGASLSMSTNRQNVSPACANVQRLHLDFDLEPELIEQLQILSPNVQHLSLNVSRVCCVCPDVPEFIYPEPIAAPNVPVIPAGQQELPSEGNESPAAVPLPPPPEFEVVEDNCDQCCQQVMRSIGTAWPCLQSLSIGGARCKEAAIRLLPWSVHLVSFQTCERYSLRLLIDVVYDRMRQHPSHSMTLHLGSAKFQLIQRLSTKPVNLCIRNVDPLVSFENEQQ